MSTTSCVNGIYRVVVEEEEEEEGGGGHDDYRQRI
jgi:hypothetical protein